jgi:hypothetical protein
MYTHSEHNRSSKLSSSLRKCLFCSGLALAVAGPLAIAGTANAQSATFYQEGANKLGKHMPLEVPGIESCTGKVRLVQTTINESLLTTTAVFGTSPGGGQGGQFDPTPILTIPNVRIAPGQCLTAHLSAMVGNGATYGVSTEAVFQVSLTPTGGGAPVAMEGHYATPYGYSSPAVATAAYSDVCMFAANFFQGDDGDVPPGTYNINVWWAGAPSSGGAIGTPFVLTVYEY